MQSQSSSTAPSPSPQAPPLSQQAPALAPPRTAKRPSPPSRRGLWITLFVIAAAIGAGVYLWQKRAATERATASVQTIRTAQVWKGGVDGIIRLTGSTGAENFASLITPQLRGN